MLVLDGPGGEIAGWPGEAERVATAVTETLVRGLLVR